VQTGAGNTKNLTQHRGVTLFEPDGLFRPRKIGIDFIYISSGYYFNL